MSSNNSKNMSSESVVDPTVQHATGSVDGSDATEPQQHQPVRQAIEKVKSSNVVQVNKQ